MNGSPEKTPAEMLSTPVKFLPGVGPDRAVLLNKLGLFRAGDLLFFFPRGYEDFSQIRRVDEFVEGEATSAEGTVEEIDERGLGPGRSMLGVLFRQDSLYFRGLWFNQSFMRKKFQRGKTYLLSGEPKFNGGRWEMHHPKVELVEEGEEAGGGRVLPVYRLTEGLNQGRLRRMVEQVLSTCTAAIEEVFPLAYLDEHRLWPIRTALPQVHFPVSLESAEQARRRFIYQELLVMQLALALRRSAMNRSQQAPLLPVTAKVDARIRRLFPFTFTAGQNQAIAEVTADMNRSLPMNRLLQGEVGSGKTVVALYAMLVAVAGGHQAVLMAPTEVLAQQHYRTLSIALREARAKVALLTGSQTGSERRATMEEITAGRVDIVIGTQAILSEAAAFSKLGLVVIDEQHKFGVRQRARLKAAGQSPHYLVMTATPIPRTVSMTQFGDLDITELRETPPGRPVVHTYIGSTEQREKWWSFFVRKLQEGRQGYVVVPLVEASETITAASAEHIFQELQNKELKGFNVAMIHGRMNAEEKDTVMKQFSQGKIQVLVATSVVEVGIDVANATLMTIESAERFGLAQLHQLRGRVSRGKYPGFVCAFTGAGSADIEQPRLEAFANVSNGFELAEIDFNLRGPGDLFSTRQHGVPPLLIADLLRDAEVLEEARRDALALIAADPDLSNPQYERLRAMAMRRYSESFDLGDVG